MASPRSGILVVDDDDCIREVVCEAVAPLALQCTPLSSGTELLEHLAQCTPELIILDLVMPGTTGLDLIRELRDRHELATVPIIVLTGSSTEEVAKAFDAGADDYVTKPFRHDELLARVKRQLTVRDRLDRLASRERDLERVVDLVQRMAQPEDIRSVLLGVVTQVAEICDAARVSLVLARGKGDVAFVVVSSDDPELKDLPIRLSDYPEVGHCITKQAPVVVEDAHTSELLEGVRANGSLPFGSMALAPITDNESAMGALFVRFRSSNSLDRSRVGLLSTIGHAAGVAIRNAQLYSSLRAESKQSVEARLQAERRVRLFQPYAEFFKNSAEGMVVIDPGGRILFANPKAREMAGDRAKLEGANVVDFIHHEEQGKAQRLAHAFRNHIYPTGIDVRMHAKQELILNVNSSATLRDEHGVLLTFRDVTRERQTERELTQTKVFLERLIDSSIDAIVSADLNGQVVVFNRAAARIFGFEPGDVIGQMNVERLYPPGVAKQVMRKIRSREHGGRDRLEDYQVNMLDSRGRQVPVKISAGLIFEKGSPVGSVGIFTDIRDQLRMEAHLRQAQDELKEHEKSIAVAQLAGATAHELNQPLTSVIAYAELLGRKLGPESPLSDAAARIVDQAQRMANIVRQIGKITKYETKSYVGGAKILDLEKASEATSQK